MALSCLPLIGNNNNNNNSFCGSLFTYLLAAPHGWWDLTRDQTCAPVVEALSQPHLLQRQLPLLWLHGPPVCPQSTASVFQPQGLGVHSCPRSLHISFSLSSGSFLYPTSQEAPTVLLHLILLEFPACSVLISLHVTGSTVFPLDCKFRGVETVFPAVPGTWLVPDKRTWNK